MCGGSPPTPPPAPDPTVTADNQYDLNKKTQAGSLVDQSTPYGTLKYTSTTDANGVPHYTANTQLSPAQQKLLNANNNFKLLTEGMSSNLLKSTGDQYKTNPNFSDMAGGLTQKLLGQETSYLNPQFDRQSSQLEAHMISQGLTPESPAWKGQMMDLEGNQNRAVTGFLASSEPQAFQQAVQSYQLPLQTSNALATMGQPGSVSNNLVNTGAAQLSPIDYGSMVNNSFNNQMAGYGAQVGSYNNNMSGMMGAMGNIGGAAFGKGGAASGDVMSSLIGTLPFLL